MGAGSGGASGMTGATGGAVHGVDGGAAHATGSMGTSGGNGGGAGNGATGSAGSSPPGDGGTGGGSAGGSAEAGMAATGVVSGGTCCPSGNCICRDPPPSAPTSNNGPYSTDSFVINSGTAYYPTNADAPLAAISICPGFLNTGPEMTPWGPFYASWGIVTVVTNTGAADPPNTRGDELEAAVQELRMLNTTSGNPLFGKLAGRYGTSGYSMGGGGTTFASGTDPSLMTSIGLAAWGPSLSSVTVPSLFICSDSDSVASCSGSNGQYSAIDNSTPKMLLDIPGQSHFNWFSPTDALGESGAYGLAFQKLFLEGDTRWKPVLLTTPSAGTVQTNIQ